VDLSAALRWLKGAGVESLLVEGGAGVITSMLAAGVVDRLIVSVAPTLIGSGTAAVGDLGVQSIANGLHLNEREIHQVGRDLVVSGTLDVPETGNGREPDVAD
jgi:riboflavin biosynthesis pyrimidine reductase